MLTCTPFSEVHHHLSDTLCKIKEPEKTLIYERTFYRDRFVTSSRLDSLASDVERNRTVLDHPNIVNYESCASTDSRVVVTRPYVNGENYYYYVSLANLPKAAAISATRNLAKIVKFVHSKDLSCMNLTPANVIIDSAGALRLVDCCVESVFYDNYHDRNTAVDMLFLGPEGLNEASLLPHRKSRDIWCLGLIIYFTFAGAYPWPLNNKMKLLNVMMKGEVRPPDGLNPSLSQLITRMLDKNPLRRPDIKSVCHELKMLEKAGNCCRVNTTFARSVGQLPIYKPSHKQTPPSILARSCKLQQVQLAETKEPRRKA